MSNHVRAGAPHLVCSERVCPHCGQPVASPRAEAAPSAPARPANWPGVVLLLAGALLLALMFWTLLAFLLRGLGALLYFLERAAALLN